MGYSLLYIIIYTARVPNFNQNQRKHKNQNGNQRIIIKIYNIAKLVQKSIGKVYINYTVIKNV